MRPIGPTTPTFALNDFFVETTQVLDQSTAQVATAIAYLCAACAAAMVWRILRPESGTQITPGGRWRRRFWAATSMLLFFASFDRIFAVLAYIADVGRGLFAAMELYENRGSWQIGAMIAVTTITFTALAAGLIRTRRLAVSRSLKGRDVGAVTMLLGLAAWIACRAISWHDFEVLLTRTVGHIQVSVIVEWSMLCLLATFAVWTIHWQATQRGIEKPVLLSSS